MVNRPRSKLVSTLLAAALAAAFVASAQHVHGLFGQGPDRLALTREPDSATSPHPCPACALSHSPATRVERCATLHAPADPIGHAPGAACEAFRQIDRRPHSSRAPPRAV